MKKTFLSIAVVAMSFFITSCDGGTNLGNENQNSKDVLQDNETSSVVTENMGLKKVNETYSILIPNEFSITTLLNYDASLQYNDLDEEKYFIVIDEGKQEFIDVMIEGGNYDKDLSVVDNFSGIQISGFASGMKISSQTDVKKTIINGMDARIFSFDAEVEGIPFPISYFTAYVVGEETIYTLMGWTLESSKKQYENQVKSIIHSIKEI